MKKFRLALSLLSIAAMVFVFVTPGVFLTWWLGWITRIQLVPAIMAGSLVVLALLALFVLLFGRLYCSVICPLGISQDILRGIAKLCRLPIRRVPGGRKLKILRLASLFVFIVLCFFGFTGLLEPYGIFGRFLSIGVLKLGTPAVQVTIWSIAFFVLIVGVGLFIPRGWCNVHCPVGTFLGLFSRFAIFRIRIDTSKCVKCGFCAKKCETGALEQGDDRAIRIDHSRCVVCGNCSAACRIGALTWR